MLMVRPQGDDYIVLPNGTRIWGLTPEWIQRSNHYMRVTTIACKVSRETGVSVSEVKKEIIEQIPLESVTIDMNKYNALIADGRARRDAQKSEILN